MEDNIHLQYKVKKVSPAESGKSTESTGRSFQHPSLVYPMCTKPGSFSAVFELDFSSSSRGKSTLQRGLGQSSLMWVGGSKRGPEGNVSGLLFHPAVNFHFTGMSQLPCYLNQVEASPGCSAWQSAGQLSPLRSRRQGAPRMQPEASRPAVISHGVGHASRRIYSDNI